MRGDDREPLQCGEACSDAAVQALCKRNPVRAQGLEGQHGDSRAFVLDRNRRDLVPHDRRRPDLLDQSGKLRIRFNPQLLTQPLGMHSGCPQRFPMAAGVGQGAHQPGRHAGVERVRGCERLPPVRRIAWLPGRVRRLRQLLRCLPPGPVQDLAFPVHALVEEA
ncbi:MAG: hypothetical protein U5K38_11550 [Woeseiaceae bacterium]|nr:hypothetical protein [Woeseiaceae bacterium]